MSDPTMQQIEQTVGITLKTLAPVVINAVAQGASATTPQGASLMIGAAILETLIQAQAAGASEIVAMYNALAPQISADETTIEQAAAQRGV